MENQVRKSRTPRLVVEIYANDLLRLIESHEEWAGSLHPEDRDEYLAEFSKLKAQATKRLVAFCKYYKVKSK